MSTGQRRDDERSQLEGLLATLEPQLHDGVVVVTSVAQGHSLGAIEPIATMREEEGLTVVTTEAAALAAGLPILFRAAWITLRVHSDLAAVGLTASISGALASRGIACNLVAGAYHDHLFVTQERGVEALECLRALQRTSLTVASRRESLERLALEWVSLWSVPVDWARFERLHADDFIDHSSAGRPADKAGFALGLKSFVAAFPDLDTRIDRLVVDIEQSTAAIAWTAAGTHRGTYLGIEPTGRKTVFRGIEIVAMRDGKIAARWGEWDASDLRD